MVCWLRKAWQMYEGNILYILMITKAGKKGKMGQQKGWIDFFSVSVSLKIDTFSSVGTFLQKIIIIVKLSSLHN